MNIIGKSKDINYSFSSFSFQNPNQGAYRNNRNQARKRGHANKFGFYCLLSIFKSARKIEERKHIKNKKGIGRRRRKEENRLSPVT